MEPVEYLAHSARDGFPSQSYRQHVTNVREDALKNARAAAEYAVSDGELLVGAVGEASLYHDLGKLNDDNQKALRQIDGSAHLPVNHVDAGAAWLIRKGGGFSTLAVYSHHSGLPCMAEERLRKNNTSFRDRDVDTRRLVDGELELLERRHRSVFAEDVTKTAGTVKGDESLFCRILLSCLADADHSDTARHYGRFPDRREEPALRAAERLESLERYVRGKFGGDNGVSERNALRWEMYAACRDADFDSAIVSCDSPVGSGKTTAVMAHLLRQAVKRNARRVFVVLPYTNIIKQSVEIYRRALTLEGEDPEQVVAELHHRADFQSLDTRALTSQWRAPIIVTTAVAFFETIASNRPAALRRLHQLPGSVIFVDEAHAAMPVKLLPAAWRWMQVLADRWSCYWVLASGSLVKFWTLEAEEWDKEPRDVPNIISESLRERLMKYEKLRIGFRNIPAPLSRRELAERVISAPGPRLVIMNTVRGAAVMAKELSQLYGVRTFHISTVLNAEDRERTIQRVKERLSDKNDTDWVLVATSCVEAGVDFSFRTGFRETASLLSLLQAAGRVNRGGESDDAVIWSFTMRDDQDITKNKGLELSSKILRRFFDKGIPIEPSLSTVSVQRELNKSAMDLGRLLKAEREGNYPEVERLFKIIDENTVLVVADEELKDKIRYGGASWTDIQRKAVSVREEQVKKSGLRQLADGLYDWDIGYDDFLGVMSGVLSMGDFLC